MATADQKMAPRGLEPGNIVVRRGFEMPTSVGFFLAVFRCRSPERAPDSLLALSVVVRIRAECSCAAKMAAVVLSLMHVRLSLRVAAIV